MGTCVVVYCSNGILVFFSISTFPNVTETMVPICTTLFKLQKLHFSITMDLVFFFFFHIMLRVNRFVKTHAQMCVCVCVFIYIYKE
jgi:hypothetical protein